MSNKTEVTPVANPLDELERKRLMEIRFDCVVKMFDFGVITRKGSLLTPERNLPPQWFALVHRVTLEEIEYSTDAQLGKQIKDAYMNLKEAIRKYENK